ncbi:sigma factor-like helix-turn-helix DNA-binding protein [Sphingobium limneticum]|uniref:sigma factor-like helix-turn-helix DNA-binding protein n=1 Tax=Sphingobium limneticum TaxID=1007511 RepID=UPI003D0101C4
MTFLPVLSQALAKLILCIQNLAGDDRCCARIDRYLDIVDLRMMAAPIGVGGGEEAARIRQVVAKMEPLTRSILILVVGQKMSVGEVSRRFGMREERVCRHYRAAVCEVAARCYAKGAR